MAKQSLVDVLVKTIVEPADVHFRGVDCNVIPSYVRTFLGISDKFIPAKPLPSYKKWYNSIDEFKIAITRKAVAVTFPARAPTEIDVLRSKLKCFRRASSWFPELKQIPTAVSTYTSMVADDLCVIFYNSKCKQLPD